MGRPQRINVAGGLYHLIQRGNNRQLIFFGEEDRRAFLNRLERCMRECGCLVHAYCLMSNHLHLLIETTRPNLSTFGQRLFGGYTLSTNRRHRRGGHLFQGRFTSVMVQQDPYLLQVSRYIHLNPVKARMVLRPEDYPWSSMRAYLPAARGPSWVCTQATLAYFNGDRHRYVAFVHEGMGQSGETVQPKQQRSGTVVIAAARVESTDQPSLPDGEAQAILSDLPERVITAVSQCTGILPEQLRRRYARDPAVVEAKALLAYVLRQTTSLTLRTIGQHLGGIGAPTVVKYLRWVPVNPSVLAQAQQILPQLSISNISNA